MKTKAEVLSAAAKALDNQLESECYNCIEAIISKNENKIPANISETLAKMLTDAYSGGYRSAMTAIVGVMEITEKHG